MKPLDHYLSGFQHPYSTFNLARALSIYKTRNPFSNKGDFGHALLLAGSYGKIGAAVLAAKACLSSGAGLLTVHIPSCGYEILQTVLPEVMVTTDQHAYYLTNLPENVDKYQSAGIGPGIGLHAQTESLLKNFLHLFRNPCVLDADALNIISAKPELFSALSVNSILTPHPKEFDRLFGESKTAFDRFEIARNKAIQYKIILVLKGHFTGVFYPDGKISFNTSGNAGMAKGGSGDVLTGIITALLAQSYEPGHAAALGVYLHGVAGDMAAKLYSEESMLPSDLIQCLGKTFLKWKAKK